MDGLALLTERFQAVVLADLCTIALQTGRALLIVDTHAVAATLLKNTVQRQNQTKEKN